MWWLLGETATPHGAHRSGLSAQRLPGLSLGALAILKSIADWALFAFDCKTCASQLDRSSEGSKRRSRIGSKGVKSMVRATLSSIISARASPVAGGLRTPQTLWPVAT